MVLPADQAHPVYVAGDDVALLVVFFQETGVGGVGILDIAYGLSIGGCLDPHPFRIVRINVLPHTGQAVQLIV